MTLSSLSPYSNKALICGAHRWEIKYTYLQDIYCIVKPWIQRNKSLSQIKMCMCGEWMVYGDDGDNKDESLIVLFALSRGYIPSCGEWDALLFSFLLGGYLVPLILLSDTCPFLPLVSLFLFIWGSGHLPLFISSYLFFSFSSFFRALISWDNIASGSNKITWAFISQEKTEIFLAILSQIRGRIFWGGSGDGNGWIYVDGTSGVEVACEWTCKWVLI